MSADLGRALTRFTDRLAAVPGWVWFALAAPLITLTHIWAGVLGQLLVHWIYTDWSRPNLAFYAGIGWMAVSLVTWGVSLLRVAEWTGVVQRITPSGQGHLQRLHGCLWRSGGRVQVQVSRMSGTNSGPMWVPARDLKVGMHTADGGTVTYVDHPLPTTERVWVEVDDGPGRSVAGLSIDPMSAPQKVANCVTCGGDLHAGDQAWQSPITHTITPDAVTSSVDYECDDCHDEADVGEEDYWAPEPLSESAAEFMSRQAVTR